jgi:hypothetical protein
MALLLTLVALAFFQDSPYGVRLLVFFFMFVGVLGFGVAVVLNMRGGLDR